MSPNRGQGLFLSRRGYGQPRLVRKVLTAPTSLKNTKRKKATR